MIRKIGNRWLTMLLIVTTAFSFQLPLTSVAAEAAESQETQEWSEQQFIDNDYILYFVNAGDPTPSTLEGNDIMGLYASVTEQVYGLDPGTGKAWGLTSLTTATSVPDAATKSGSLRYYNGAQVREKAVSYKFELPEDQYDITFGFNNPWSNRSVNLIAEGRNVADGDYEIGTKQLNEFTYRGLAVTDGMLEVSIGGPSTASLTNHNDPLINYIIVRKSVLLGLSDLQTIIGHARELTELPEYTSYSIHQLKTVIEAAQAFVDNAVAQGTDAATLQNELHSYKQKLGDAVAALVPYAVNSSFKPGAVWTDTNGAPIQAHGGGVLYDQASATYYWYGEDKTYGYMPTRGVRVYSSKDLYNWKDEGLALTAIESMDQFTSDPLISGLYAGRLDQADVFNDIGTMRVLERPKVIYNDSTKKYVMWLHTDGPSTTSTANYAKAEAGYALSDSPTGPFVYGKSERMDRAPEGAEYNGQPNQPGMARDMNLFKDDDGTAYLIYSSEENMTMYISKLNASYTDVTGWHKDGNEERDATYKAEYGVDYVRVFPGAQREAPAMFKYQEKYYMITSGATGWAPNPARYTVADEIFGEWKAMRDPSSGSKASTTFDSQSTHVITVDAANGKYIFMGDRWNSGNLTDSRYIWLPLEFGQGDQLLLKWYDEWNLSVLNRMGKITVNTPLPQFVPMGQTPVLPEQLSITQSNNITVQMPVLWTLNTDSFSKPGRVTVSGILPELENKEIFFSVDVLPKHAVYFVNAGGVITEDYTVWTQYLGDSLLNKGVPDQQYNPDLEQHWGYVGDNTNTSGSTGGDLFSTLRYLKANSGNDLTYKFDLGEGLYSIYTGLYDPWAQYSNGGRKADIIVNGQTLASTYVFTSAKDVLAFPNVAVADSGLELTVHRAAAAAASSSDPQISWIMVLKVQTAQEVADTLTELAAPEQDAVKLVLPVVPEGYSLAIKETGDASVIGLDGLILPPKNQTEVELVLEVTRELDSSKGTVTVKVTVPARAASAQEIADTLTELAAPARDALRLVLPEVPTGYRVAIQATGSPSVIQLDGSVIPPSEPMKVELTLEVTRLSDGSKGTVRLIVTVPAKSEPNGGGDPGTDPGTNPGTDPGTNPGTDPGANPGSSNGNHSGGNSGNSSTDSSPGSGSVIAGTVVVDSAGGKPGLVAAAAPVLSNGVATIAVDSAALKAALGQSKTAILEIPKVQGAASFMVNLPVGALSGAADQKLRISMENATLELPARFFSGTDIAGAKQIGLSIGLGDPSRLDSAVRSQIGSRPVIELKLLVNGAVHSWKNTSAPVQVALPYTPSAGEDVEHLVILYINEEGSPQNVTSGKYDAATGQIRFTATHFSTYAAAYVERTFEDIAAYGWAKQAIEVMASKGVIHGTSQSAYTPAAAVKRGDFIVLLVRALGLTAELQQAAGFTDVADTAHWSEAISIARQLGVANGKGNQTFEPDAPITRQEMFVLISRALKAAGQGAEAAAESAPSSGSEAADGTLGRFADRNEISGYASASVAELVHRGIISGDGSALRPLGTATRAEAAVLIYRIYNQQ